MSIIRSKSFSDWDQIRDLVKDQYPNLRFHKVRDSETPESYQVRIQGKGEDQVATIPINGKSALDNFVEATNMKVENNLRRPRNNFHTEYDTSENQLKRHGINMELVRHKAKTPDEKSEFLSQLSKALEQNPRLALHMYRTDISNMEDADLQIDQDTAEKCLDTIAKFGDIGYLSDSDKMVIHSFVRKLTDPGSGDKYYDYGFIPEDNPTLSPQKLDEICSKCKEGDKRLNALSKNKNATPELLFKLYKKGLTDLVWREDCPKEIVRDFIDENVDDLSERKLEILAERSNLSAKNLVEMARRAFGWIAQTVAKSPSVNREVINEWMGPWNKFEWWKQRHPEADWYETGGMMSWLGAADGRMDIVASPESRANKADYNYAIAAINADIDPTRGNEYRQKETKKRINDPRFDSKYQEFAGKLRDLYNDQGYKYHSVLHELYPNFSDFLGAFDYDKKYRVNPTKIGKLCLRKYEDKNDGKSVDLKISPEDLK